MKSEKMELVRGSGNVFRGVGVLAGIGGRVACLGRNEVFKGPQCHGGKQDRKRCNPEENARSEEHNRIIRY